MKVLIDFNSSIPQFVLIFCNRLRDYNASFTATHRTVSVYRVLQMRGGGYADVLTVLQVPDNKADAVPCKRLQYFKYYFNLRATIKLPVLAKELLRLDLILLQKGLATSRNQAQALISTGKVRVEGNIIDKAGHRFSADAQIELAENLNPYVSRGGLKLAHALEYFAMDVHGLVCMDVGASTGGFTDCLLQKGASKVYAVDVGYGQLDWRLRNDERVVPIERTNIRYLPPDVLDSQIYLATIDTSFISLRLVIPSILPFMHRKSRIIALVKPQFEVGKGKVGKGGIVKDPKLHQEVLDRLILFCNKLKLTVIGVTPSPILGAKGNKEFLMLIEYHGDHKVA